MKTVTLQQKNKIQIEKTIYLNATETEVQLARFYMANITFVSIFYCSKKATPSEF